MFYVITEPGSAREGEILESLVKMSEQREMLVSMMARDRERYRLEDRELQIKMAEQGIRYCVVRSLVWTATASEDNSLISRLN